MATKRQEGRTTRLRTGDSVKVISGKHKGQSGKVLSIDRVKNRVFVEKVNVIRKALRPTQDNPQGGYREQEASVNATNVMVVDPKTGETTRIGMQFLADGRKVRIARKSGVRLDED